MTEKLLPVLFRWLHIVPAVLLVGGALFSALVHLPAARRALGDEARAALLDAVAARWRWLVFTGIALLLASGFYNFVKIGVPKGREAPAYHAIFGVKFLLALAVFAISSALVGRSETFAFLRRRAQLWAGVNALLATAIVLLSGVLKNLA